MMQAMEGAAKIRSALLCALPLLCSGCMLFTTGDPSHVGAVPEGMKQQEIHVPSVYDLHPFGDVSGVKVGSWATYREGRRTITLAATGREGDDVWIEVIEEGEPRRVSARRVAPDGRVVAAFYRALPSPRAHRQQLKQAPAEERDDLREVRRNMKEAKGEVGGQPVTIRTETVTLEDLDGRRRTEETLWSPDVPPLYDGSEHGGLVRRGEVELLKFGTGAARLVQPLE